jgi:hypothetical protein
MRTVHGGALAEDTSAAPIGFKYDNGNAQYVNMDLSGQQTGITERGHGIANQLGNMANDMKPIILAAASGGAFGPEGILASRIVNAGTAIQRGDTLGGLSQLAGIAKMLDTATALSVARAINNKDFTSLATAALSKTDSGKGIGSTEILPDLTVRSAFNLASAVNGLTSTNPRTVINSLVDLQDRAPDLFNSVTSAVTGNGGGDTTLQSYLNDRFAGGEGGDDISSALDAMTINADDPEAGWDAWTLPGSTALNNVTVSGSNGATGTDAIDTILGNLDTTRSLGTTPTVLNEVTTTGTCPAGEHKDPITGKCVPNVGALDTVEVTGTCPTGYTKNPVTGACELDVLTVDQLPDLPPVTKLCGYGQHLDPKTNECVNDSPLDVLDTCPTGQTRNPVTGKCETALEEVVINSCPVGMVRDPISGKCVDVVEDLMCGEGMHAENGVCVPNVVDTSCPAGQHKDASGKCVPNTTTTTTPVLPPVAPTGALPTYTDPTGIPGKVLTLGQMGNLMKYDVGLDQLDVPALQHWSDMADMALPTADVSKAASALAQYAPDAEKDVIPRFYAHGGAVQHLAEGAQPDVQALLASYDKANVMDALKNLGNIGSGLEPSKSKVFSLGQMGTPGQQKQLQQMTVIPELAAILRGRGIKLAEGGRADHEHPEYDGNPVFRTGGLSGLGGKYVEGKGDGTSDDITAMLANGEYVFSADVVSALGNGSNKAGAKELDHMVQAIRSRARSAPPDKLPPDAKSPLEYLKSSKGSKNG